MEDRPKSAFKRLIDQLVKDLSQDIAGQRVLKYIVKELHKKRDLPDILNDSYVKNRISDERADELIADPEIIQAVEEGLKLTFKEEEF
jgi:hypothetical protein